jgi:hypothetical protein
MLPSVKIRFVNGALGLVAASADGVCGFTLTGTAVVGKFELATAYILYRFDMLTDLGITAENNPCIYKTIKEFYDEGQDGRECWLMAFPDTVKVSDMLDKTKAYATLLLDEANGRLQSLTAKRMPAVGYVPTIENGMDADVELAKANAMALIGQYTDMQYSPFVVFLEGYAYNGTPADLNDLHEEEKNSLCIMIGDVVSGSKGAAIGLLAGRFAKSPVNMNIGRVRSGALATLSAFILDKTIPKADIETLHNKGYITFRKIVRKSGFYFNDDFTATSATDDYSHLTHRRTINKAFRIAYDTLVDELLEEIPVNADGTLQAPMVMSWQQRVENAIASAMAGELSADATDPNDKGVKCFIDYNQKPQQDSKISVSIKVRPFGYARYIDVPLGFLEVTA